MTVVIDFDEYPICAVVDGPNGRATRLAFYKSMEDVRRKDDCETAREADYAIDFSSARVMQQWFVINEQLIRRIRMAIER